MKGNGFSRRGFLKGVAAASGLAIGARLPGSSFIGNAFAAGEPAAVLVLHLTGGYNALFGSADSFVGGGTFGVTAGNHTVLNGVGLDNVFANATTGLGAFGLANVASVGVRHGISSHGAARGLLWTHNGGNAALHLANAIGGTGATKAAVVGGNLIGEAPRTAVNGISFQSINDMQSTINALGGGLPNPRVPDRPIALSGIENAHAMSANAIAASPKSLESVDNGFKTAVATLRQPVQVFNLAQLRTAYGIGNVTAVRTFASKMAAAELMIRSGTNVVAAFDGGWDTHGDRNGNTVRNKMTALMPALRTFIARMVAEPTRNVNIVIMGDFSRSLPGSDHQPNLTVTTIGRNVKRGTTGRTDASVRLAANTPSVPGMWSYLAALTGVANSPWGANQHPTLLK